MARKRNFCPHLVFSILMFNWHLILIV